MLEFIGSSPSFAATPVSGATLNAAGSTWAFDNSGWQVNLGGSGQAVNLGGAGAGVSPWLLLAGALAVLWVLRR